MQPTSPRLESSSSLPSLDQLALPKPNILAIHDNMNIAAVAAPMPSLVSHPPGLQPQDERRHTLPPIKSISRASSLTPSPPLVHRRLSFSSSSSSAPYSRPTTPLFQPYPSTSPVPHQLQHQHYPTQHYQKQPQQQPQQHQLAQFKCPHCPQVYRKIGHLNRHALTHQGTRFSCQIVGCRKTFSRLDNMRTHMKNMHTTD